MNELKKKSEIVIFAGPNGSGKSTFTSLLKPSMDYINADEIKKILKCSDFEAAKLAEKQREEHLKNMEDFCFETVLSTGRNLNLLKRVFYPMLLYPYCRSNDQYFSCQGTGRGWRT